ncbi:MAG TPA: PTS sugar transporter subunit IIA [Gemmatimonadales bacterium]|nr:PTS sugar transporter subunit IIA [Gemmatimonadales bacterium]
MTITATWTCVLLTDLLHPDRVRVPLAGRDKPAILRELSRLLAERTGGQEEDILRAVEEREAVLSTGIGYGVAIPHGRAATVPELSLVAGSTPVGVDFDSVDGLPVRLFFLLVGPENAAGQHVKALSRIARVVRRDQVRERLLQAATATEFIQTIVDAEER